MISTRRHSTICTSVICTSCGISVSVFALDGCAPDNLSCGAGGGVTCAWNGWCAHPQQAEEHTPRECCQTCTLGLGAGPFRFPARLQEVWNVPWPAGYIAAVVQPPVSYRVVQGWPYGVGLIEVPSEMVRGRALPVSSRDRAGLRFRSFTGRMHGSDAGCNIIGLYQLTSLFVKLQMLSRGPSLAGHFQESTVQG